MNFDNFEIKPITEKDIEGYFTLVSRNRERLARYFPFTMRETHSLAATTAHIAGRIQRAQRKEYITYLVHNNQTKEIVATIFIKDIDWNIPKCELGFYIDRDYEGRGLTTKIVKNLVAHCFEELKINKLFMRIALDNMASRRVAEKNGFIVEGHLRCDFKTTDGELIDALYYGIVNPNLEHRPGV